METKDYVPVDWGFLADLRAFIPTITEDMRQRLLNAFESGEIKGFW